MIKKDHTRDDYDNAYTKVMTSMIGDLVSKETVCFVGGKVKH